jgi:hypothetical protein
MPNALADSAYSAAAMGVLHSRQKALIKTRYKT